MKKQEKIREGIARIPMRVRFNTVEDGWGSCFLEYENIDNILAYLHSQGCVLTTDKKLPEGGFPNWIVAVEPLIK